MRRINFIKELRDQSRELGIPFWRLPDFILIVMTLVNISAMIGTYLITARLVADPREAVLLVAAEAAVIVVIGNVLVESAKGVLKISQLRKEIVHIISHQIRTPITTIKWNLEVLKRKQNAGKTSKKELSGYIDRIYEENEKIREMTEEMLNLSRLEEERRFVRPMEFDLVELVNDCILMVKGYATIRKIEIKLKSPETLSTFGSRDRVKAIVINLLENAIRYSEEGSKVAIELKELEAGVDIIVSDQGIGIPEKDQKDIFKKFYRGENARKHRQEGTGLGLYVVKSSVDQLGGEISLSSEVGKGTTFKIFLPVEMKEEVVL